MAEALEPEEEHLTSEQQEWWEKLVKAELEKAVANEEAEWEDPTGGLLSHALMLVDNGAEGAVQLRALLDKEAEMDVNMAGPDGDTLLHMACLYGNGDAVRVLVDHGADVNVKNTQASEAGSVFVCPTRHLL